MEGGGDKGAVCVTGCTGFVASWLIMRLLQHGYSVRATVRSPPPGGKKDISFLTSLPGATEKLQIFNADMSQPDSFDAAIEGCVGVFHVAHTTDFESKEPEDKATERAINGTLGILNACLNSNTVKRVVYTSSAAAVVFKRDSNGVNEEEEVLDESAWSDVEFLRGWNSKAAAYMISKTLTERAALEFAEKHGLDLVTVIPSLIVGPFLCPRIPGSVYTSLSMILGNQDHYTYLISASMVHIDDVAAAHIFLFEHPHAKGRYNCSSHDITIHGLSEFLSTRYPEFKIPTADYLKDIDGYRAKGLSSKKLMDSGFNFEYGLNEMYDGAIQCCKEKGFL
ncbi:vestitone reductase-like isoform X1 [Malania oleifera]|uniref:vestitone reductase-like isoform X1 n=1 Tax=Malania oleifera TaxID=397392 RepID=UPI0025AE4B79|nr:vestitone reductase-like isoform X1 [Malania oleifera]